MNLIFIQILRKCQYSKALESNGLFYMCEQQHIGRLKPGHFRFIKNTLIDAMEACRPRSEHEC